jgi:hypothetical protein
VTKRSAAFNSLNSFNETRPPQPRNAPTQDSPLTVNRHRRTIITSPGWKGLQHEIAFSGGFSVRVTGTPLPAALPLFATGLGALGLLGWRRKRTAHSVVCRVGL